VGKAVSLLLQTKIVLIEYSPRDELVYVRGVWPEPRGQKLAPIHEDNTQEYVRVTEGMDNVGRAEVFRRLCLVAREGGREGLDPPPTSIRRGKNVGYFESYDDANFQFVADITAASDKGIDKQYSMEPLLTAIQKKFEGNGLSRNHVYLQAGGNAEQVFRREDRARLPWMPGELRFEEVFFKDAGFVRFLEAVRGNRNESRQYRFGEPIDLTVSYNPRQTSAGMTHFNYKQANLIEWNSYLAH